MRLSASLYPSLSLSLYRFLSRAKHKDELDDNQAINNTRQLILSSAQSARNEALNYMQAFAAYGHMWMEADDSAEHENAVADVHSRHIAAVTDAIAICSTGTYSFQSQVGIFHKK